MSINSEVPTVFKLARNNTNFKQFQTPYEVDLNKNKASYEIYSCNKNVPIELFIKENENDILYAKGHKIILIVDNTFMSAKVVK